MNPLKLIFNPVEARFEFVNSGSSSDVNIVTHFLNQSGNPLVLFDTVTNTYKPLDFLVVTDNDGNVVTD